MKRSFSFSEKPVLFLLQKFPSLLPGISKVVSLYYDMELQRLNSYTLLKVKDEYSIKESEVNDPDESLKKLRKLSVPYSWIQSEDIPFEASSENDVQLTIFNELNNNVLLLRIKNEYDELNDLFFIYFSNNLSNFGIVDNKKIITTDNKVIIGHLLKNSVDAFLSNQAEDRELFIILSENNQTVIQELTKIKRELFLTKEKSKDGIIHLCKSHLEDLSSEYGYDFILSDESIVKLRDYNEDPGLLRNILSNAANYAHSTHLNRNWKEIIIHDYHLIFNYVPNKKPAEFLPETVQNSEIPVRYNRTFLFLNKLETAAQTVKSKNLLLTSMNVGQEFPSPITPAAITDALKNHQSKINYLFTLLPNRWQIIRSEFRPVQNMLNSKTYRQKRSA